MKIRVLLALLIASTASWAQKVSIKKVELAGEKIIVHYDLEDSNPNNEYQIALYSSQSNFATALTKVKGDVGSEVKPGTDKKIEWSVREELGGYKGKISLEVRGKMFVPLAKFTNLTEKTKLKRGKSHTITWKAGNSNPINIELLNGGQRITSELNQPNSGSYTLFVPKSAGKGKGYIVRISDAKNPIDVSTSQAFTITPKTSFLVKLLPVLAAGGAVAALAGGGDPAESGIPLPPALPPN
jgi:Ser-Thr-rich glycosyl-phosphatidyl-inositol-anchored membrane family